MSMFSAATYSSRRDALLARLRDAGATGLVLLPGHVDSPMNYRDNAYDFRQDSSFLYFCGLQQPELALLLDLDDGRATLFGDDIGIDHLVWTGAAAQRGRACGAVRRRARRTRGRAWARRSRPRARKAATCTSCQPYRGESRLALVALAGPGRRAARRRPPAAR